LATPLYYEYNQYDFLQFILGLKNTSWFAMSGTAFNNIDKNILEIEKFFRVQKLDETIK
jgi:hypothetical protein